MTTAHPSRILAFALRPRFPVPVPRAQRFYRPHSPFTRKPKQVSHD